MAERTQFPQICIALGFPDVDTLMAHAREEYAAGERFLEMRLDYLASPERGVAAIRKFLTRHSDCVIMATCRRKQNEGRFQGSIEEQLRILEAGIDAGAKVVDVEIETRGKLRGQAGPASHRSLPADLVSQLWRHTSAHGYGAAQDDSHTGRRL